MAEPAGVYWELTSLVAAVWVHAVALPVSLVAGMKLGQRVLRMNHDESEYGGKRDA